MALAIAAQQDGFDYQARLFWREACKLFFPEERVVRVAFEAAAPKAFDDVAVFYEGKFLADNSILVADHYQSKFHQRYEGHMTWDALMTPEFVGASKVSLLERLRDGFRHYAGESRHRFILYTPWGPDPHDALSSAVTARDGQIDLQTLQGGQRSVAGQLRKRLATHLAMDEDEVLTMMRSFAIRRGPTLEELNDELNRNLRAAGLVPVEAAEIAHIYDELSRKTLRIAGDGFDRQGIKELCQQHRLWRGYTFSENGAVRLGVRSFVHGTERIAQETDHHLCLVDSFDGHALHPTQTWESGILPHLRVFFAERLERDQRYHLYLPTHTTIAFASGYLLDDKAGYDVVPIQVSHQGWKVWRPAVEPLPAAYPGWQTSQHALHSAGTDLALAISIRHDIMPEVIEYAQRHQPSIARVLHAQPAAGPGMTAILDGSHARLLAAQLPALCHASRRDLPRVARLHIFVAAPNGFAFFLGQIGRGFGLGCLYDHDLDRRSPEAYVRTICFPEAFAQH